MQRSEWLAIAQALRIQRELVEAMLPCEADAITAHDRKLIAFAKLEAIDRAANKIADVLATRACSFERERFARIIGCATPIVTREQKRRG